MIVSRIRVKRALKRVAGCVSAAVVPFAHAPRDWRVCVLMYHRIAEAPVADPQLDNWCVPPARFASQIAALSGFADVVPLSALRDGLTRTPAGKPLVCLTFDDGYHNFFSNALPVLQRYKLPAAVFVVTKFVDAAEPMPFDRWGSMHRGRLEPDAWRPATWRDLENAARSSLVTIGAHSHQHLNGRHCSPAVLMEEASRSRAILRERLGASHAWVYAYPYGSTRLGQTSQAYMDAVRASAYDLALSTDLGLVSAESDLFCLPRVEVHATDSAASLQAKVRGVLLAHHLVDRLRQADRAV